MAHTLKTDIRPNCLQNFSLYLTENTPLAHYDYHSVNIIYKRNFS
jgi:hypothetical protein